MHNPDILNLIAASISSSDTEDQTKELKEWLEQSPENKKLYEEIKQTWQSGGGRVLTIRERLSKKYIIKGLIQESLGSLVGFMVGLWISNTFTHYVKEKRNAKNLFGILGRKEVIVNEIPEWLQFFLSVLLGFIALEIIHYFFQSKSYVRIWKYVQSKI